MLKAEAELAQDSVAQIAESMESALNEYLELLMKQAQWSGAQVTNELNVLSERWR